MWQGKTHWLQLIKRRGESHSNVSGTVTIQLYLFNPHGRRLFHKYLASVVLRLPISEWQNKSMHCLKDVCIQFVCLNPVLWQGVISKIAQTTTDCQYNLHFNSVIVIIRKWEWKFLEFTHHSECDTGRLGISSSLTVCLHRFYYLHYLTEYNCHCLIDLADKHTKGVWLNTNTVLLKSERDFVVWYYKFASLEMHQTPFRSCWIDSWDVIKSSPAHQHDSCWFHFTLISFRRRERNKRKKGNELCIWQGMTWEKIEWHLLLHTLFSALCHPIFLLPIPSPPDRPDAVCILHFGPETESV